MFLTGLSSTFGKYLFARFSIDENAKSIVGGGRHELMKHTYNNLKKEKGSFFLGVDEDCTNKRLECENKWGYMGENPLAPLAYHGIFMSWPYYLFILTMFFFTLVGKHKFIHFALMLMFIQRPYVLHYGYSIFAILAIAININEHDYFRPIKLFLKGGSKHAINKSQINKYV